MARAEGITGGVLPDGEIVFDEKWQRERDEIATREAAAAAYAAELRHRCAEIDLTAGKYMAPQLEGQKPTIKPIDKARFRELQEFCKQNDWPTSLPVLPHALFEFIVGESTHGYRHIIQIVTSIKRIHEAAGEDACPTRDPLVKAYLDAVRDDENSNQKESNK